MLAQGLLWRHWHGGKEWESRKRWILSFESTVNDVLQRAHEAAAERRQARVVVREEAALERTKTREGRHLRQKREELLDANVHEGKGEELTTPRRGLRPRMAPGKSIASYAYHAAKENTRAEHRRMVDEGQMMMKDVSDDEEDILLGKKQAKLAVLRDGDDFDDKPKAVREPVPGGKPKPKPKQKPIPLKAPQPKQAPVLLPISEDQRSRMKALLSARRGRPQEPQKAPAPTGPTPLAPSFKKLKVDPSQVLKKPEPAQPHMMDEQLACAVEDLERKFGKHKEAAPPSEASKVAAPKKRTMKDLYAAMGLPGARQRGVSLRQALQQAKSLATG